MADAVHAPLPDGGDSMNTSPTLSGPPKAATQYRFPCVSKSDADDRSVEESARYKTFSRHAPPFSRSSKAAPAHSAVTFCATQLPPSDANPMRFPDESKTSEFGSAASPSPLPPGTPWKL